MFTGIVQTMGCIAAREVRGRDLRLRVDTIDLDMSDVAPGDSIAVSGVCLTVIELVERGFVADVSWESLSVTTLGRLMPGDTVNLEKALRLDDRLGGHLVSGHVDGTGVVAAVEPDGRSQRWTFEVPDALSRFIAGKGSVAVDGVSLTVNAVDEASFSVNLIPHTLSTTRFCVCKPGDRVNIEVDVIARYVERMLSHDAAAGITTDFLKRHGFD